jgi:hypothetical protein
MRCDVYYASETQDKYGKVVKEWTIDSSLPCSFYTLNDMSNNDNFDFDDKKFYRLETMLVGRTKNDIRKAQDGQYYPVSHILITNIRAANCNDEIFFVETNGGYEVTPTIYEIKSLQPYIGPYNSIEYYKIQLERSDTQEFE